jgi:hypothetical protein
MLLLSRCFPFSDDHAPLSLLLLPVLPFSSAGTAYDIGWCKDGRMGWSMATLRQRRPREGMAGVGVVARSRAGIVARRLWRRWAKAQTSFEYLGGSVVGFYFFQDELFFKVLSILICTVKLRI